MTPNKELRAYVYNILNGHVTDGTNNIPVYSLPTNEVSFPFVHLDSISLTENGTKDSVIYTARFTINIYDQHEEQLANWTRSEDIGASVVELLNGTIGDTDNWHIIVATPENYDQSEQLTETKRALQTTIIMRYLVEHK